jgi:hypothetical protein
MFDIIIINAGFYSWLVPAKYIVWAEVSVAIFF